jgi:hypothetical protein
MPPNSPRDESIGIGSSWQHSHECSMTALDFIEVYDDALDAAFCDEIIAKFEADAARQRQGQTGHGVDRSKKDSLDINTTPLADWVPFNQRLLDATLARLRDYVAKYRFLLSSAVSLTLRDPVTGDAFLLDHESFERLDARLLNSVLHRLFRPGALSVQKYLCGSGGYHHWHSEIYPRDASCETLHRVLLFMFYLNTVEEGGQTAFYYQDRQVAPRAGRMVIAPAGFTHTHKGHVPLSSDKYIVTSWILFQPAETVYGTPAAR